MWVFKTGFTVASVLVLCSEQGRISYTSGLKKGMELSPQQTIKLDCLIIIRYKNIF